MADAAVAFLWHHHQPDYRDPRTGEALLPWTRLHGVKDYYAMAKIAAEFPSVKQNFNLVPSMLDQILDLTGGRGDLYLRRSRRPASELSPDERTFLISEFFSVNWRTMIEPFPRYAELLGLSGKKSGRPAREALSRFSVQDLLDLQVWFNLAWFHPYSRENEHLVADLLGEGKGFTEEEKNDLLDLQLRLLGEVIPLYRALALSGQVELTTSPYYHPVLPLLCDTEVAREAMPDVPLPLEFPRAPEDALAQMRKAVARHEELFGIRPRGAWPSEGSVSTRVIDILAQAGIEWCATDEEILAATLSRSGPRIRLDGPDRAELLYRGYRAQSEAHSVNIIFRDHYLSDLIGFTYYNYEPKAAAADLVSHLENIARLAATKGKGTWIVPIILDGENAWEAYPGGGLAFLRELFGLLSVSRSVRTTRVSDYLEHEQIRPLQGLFAGSWIGRNFQVWIGEELNNRAWNYLGRTRAALVAAQEHLTGEALALAWEEMYRAQGSDWFWWYSRQHSSPHDEHFDKLFRSHLRGVFEAIGRGIREEGLPSFVEEPIAHGARPVYTVPYALLDVRIDGRRSDYLEWLCAGRYDPAHDQGAMARPGASAVKEVYFGFDLETFYLRIDLDRNASEYPRASFAVSFLEPKAVNLSAESLQSAALRRRADSELVGKMAADRFVELAIPFSELGIVQEQNVKFQVEFSAGDGTAERLPLSGPFAFISPTEEFDLAQWQV